MTSQHPLHPHRACPPRAFVLACLLLLLLLTSPRLIEAQPAAPDAKLEKAVATLRHIAPDTLTDEQQENTSQAIDEAWAVIGAAGQKGLARLKQELQRLDDSKERDDFFKLNASVLLWQIGRFDEAGNIANIWNTTPLTVSYNYPFYTALEAAQTHDRRAVPMLEAILRDDQGRTFFPAHAMEVPWPLTHEFVWGAYGAQGAPVLARILETSKNPVEIKSAVRLLGRAQYLPALPRIRELATSGTLESRHSPIMVLGMFGHPQDYQFLISGLQSKDAREVWAHVYALYEFEDLRAVPHLIPLLQSPDAVLRSEVIAALGHLLTPASLEALHAYSETTKDTREREMVERIIGNVFEGSKTTWQEYMQKSAQEKGGFVAARLSAIEAEYLPRKGRNPATHAEFVAQATKWKKNGRLTAAGDNTVETQDILSGATADDIELLIDVKAALYLRLSDECLYETRRIDAAVQYLSRTRYRKIAGTTERVEAIK